jgi:hypothetical protein
VKSVASDAILAFVNEVEFPGQFELFHIDWREIPDCPGAVPRGTASQKSDTFSSGELKADVQSGCGHLEVFA